MQPRTFLLVLLAVALLAASTPAHARAWATGDAWTYDVEGGKVGSLRVTVADGGARTREVDAAHAPGSSANLSQEEVTRTWAGPLRLASETRVANHCAASAGLVPVTRCGNLTERWVYTPPIEFLPPSLAANAKWSQKVAVDYTREDELDVLDDRGTTEVHRHFQVVGDAVLERVPAGEFRCWNIVMDTEEADSDAAAEAFCYAPSALQFVKRSLIQGGQETTVWKLRSFTVGAPGQPPPAPVGAATASPGGSSGIGGSSGGDNATLGPEDSRGTTTWSPPAEGSRGPPGSAATSPPPASGPDAAPRAPSPDKAAPEGPGRDLRTPGAEVALVMVVLAGAALRARRP